MRKGSSTSKDCAEPVSRRREASFTRLSTPSLPNARLMCVRTVVKLMLKLYAISLSERPLATRRAICSSRSVSARS